MITPDDLLALADVLVQGTTETEWRAAVSRAYFAAFPVAHDFLRSLRFRVPQGDRAHAYLWLRLSNSGHPPLDQAGNDLNISRRDRNFAEYETGGTLSQADARIQVLAAHRIVGTIRACLADPPRSQIRDAVRDYERNVLRDVTYQGP
jgi:hypothetical protein